MKPANFGDGVGSFRDRLKCMQIMLSRYEAVPAQKFSKNGKMFQFTQPCCFLLAHLGMYYLPFIATSSKPIPDDGICTCMLLHTMERDRHVYLCAPSILNPELLITVSRLSDSENGSQGERQATSQ